MSQILTPNDFEHEDPQLQQEVLVYWTKYKFPRLTRRQFLKLFALLAALGVSKRIYDIECVDWRSYATPKETLIKVAMQYKKPFKFGCYPDLESLDPWTNADLLRDTVGYEDGVGLFFNIEWADKTSYPGKQDSLIELLTYIHQRGSSSLLSIKTDTRPNDRHPFSVENQNWMKYHAESLFNTLDQECPYLVESRIFFEHDIRADYAFVYGPDDDLEGLAHQIGFKRTAQIFAEQKMLSRFERKLAFCPSVWCDNIGDYWLSTVDGYNIFDGAGLDGYDIFPGKLADWVDSDVSFESWLHLLGYYILGKRSPEEVFGSGLKKLVSLTNSSIPMYIYEMGSKQGDVEWLDYAAWYSAALGGDGIYPFIYNKEYQIREHNKPFEANWSKNISQIANQFALTIRQLNSR